MIDDNASEEKKDYKKVSDKNLGRNRNQRLLDGFKVISEFVDGYEKIS